MVTNRSLLGLLAGLKKLGVSEFAYTEPSEVRWVVKFAPEQPQPAAVASPSEVETLKIEVEKIMNEGSSGDPLEDPATFARQGLPSFRKYGDGTEEQ